MIQNVIIWGFVDFGNGILEMTYLPTNFEMELTILSEKVCYTVFGHSVSLLVTNIFIKYCFLP